LSKLAAASGDFVRLYRAFLVARAALGVALAGAQFSALGLGVEPGPRPLLLLLCVLYAVLALGHAVLPVLREGASRSALSRLSKPRWWASTGVDLLVFPAMLVLSGPLVPPVAALLVLPVMMSAVLATRRAGLAAAALATLGLLGSALWLSLASADWAPSMTQAGLAGMGYFVIAYLSAELAARLAGEQQAARGSMALARQQAALNQLVIDEMKEGVLVVDRQLQVRTANPAALALLGELAPAAAAPFALRKELAWRVLAETAEAALAQTVTEAPAREVVLNFARAPARTLRLRLRWMAGRPSEEAEDLLVMLLEDRAKLLARAREEKLAAMGRMSAGIAHEIRNPLAAISQANALLGEDLANDGVGQRLTNLVASNVLRLQRIVDEVMLLAAPADQQPVPMDATTLVQEVTSDWRRTQGSAQLQLVLPAAALLVYFEPDHLRRVLLNLLDNAWRHAQEVSEPWVRLELMVLDAEHLQCQVLNPARPISAEAERHLFEPFYSSRSRGSGMGLYICRELCERYRARIDYQAQSHGGQSVVGFLVTLRRARNSE
jgi:two-component system, NtrC family, sensor histidine kinase PilS